MKILILPIVGNSIYDYLKFERPKKQSQFLFLKSFSPYEALNSNGIYSISEEPYLEADIEHLRPFALSLENFPIDEDVFTND